MKIITLSFDDGEIHDIKLAKLLRKYGLKATFYLCSSQLGLEGNLSNGRHYQKMQVDLLRKTYQDFEIGSHGTNHRGFTSLCEKDILQSIQTDIQTFSVYIDKPIVCCAYPGGETDDRVMEILQRNAPVKFARTICKGCVSFEPPTNPYYCVPTMHLFDEKLERIIEEFDNLSPNGRLQILHIYAHSWEIEWQRENGWEICEKIFKRLSKVQDAVFMCNGETYEKVFCTQQ